MLISEGIGEEIVVDLATKIVNIYLDTYKKFIHAILQYDEKWRRLVRELDKRGMLSSANQLFLAYLGCLLPEGAKLIEMEYSKSDLGLPLLRDEFLGTRLFLISIARLVEDRHIIDKIYKVEKHLIKEIERLRSDEDKHTQRFATLFLEQVIMSAMGKILPRFCTTLVFYKLSHNKDKNKDCVRGKTPSNR